MSGAPKATAAARRRSKYILVRYPLAPCGPNAPGGFRMGDFFNWLFADKVGVVCLVIGGMLVCLLISFVLERRTRERYYNHEKSDDDWDLFGDDDEGDEDADK